MSRSRTGALIATAALTALTGVTSTLAAGETANTTAIDLPGLLARVGERVQAYYQRAQSIVCTETITFDFLDTSLIRDPRSRRLAYDLRLSWEKSADGERPEGTALRTLKTVNGRTPKPGDEPGCLDPKPVAVDTLSFLLPHHQTEYTFKYKGIGKAGGGRTGVMIDYSPLSREKPAFTWTDSCFAIDAPSRTRGQIWIDRFGGDVLRIDETIAGPLDVDVPRSQERKTGGVSSIVLDRSDFSIRYKTVTFTDPDEIVMLPESVEFMVVIRGQARQRTTHTFTGYQRFVTSGRVIEP
jgi:hypothetical protein